MQANSDQHEQGRRQDQLGIVAHAASLLVIVLAFTALIGRIWNIHWLQSYITDGQAVNPISAVLLILAGISLWLQRTEPISRLYGNAARALALGVALLGGFRLCELALNWHCSVDEWLLHHIITNPGRTVWIAPNTALGCFIAGMALTFLSLSGGRYLQFAQTLAIAGAALSWTAIIGHVYGITVLYRVNADITMAFNTALAILILHVGILCARARGFMTLVFSKSAGGTMARWLLPAFVILPTILGWLRLVGERQGFYQAEVGVAIMTMAMTVVTVGILWWNSVWLDRVDAERRRTSDALRAREYSTRLIIEKAHDSFIAMNAGGTIIDWNAQAESTFGWSRDKIIGQTLASTIIPQRYREAHQKGIQQFLMTGEGPVLNKRIEIVALHRDGHEFPVELTISPVQWGGSYVFNAFVHDITDRQRADEKIRESEERIRLLLDSVKDYAIFMLDPNGWILSWGPGAERIKGYTAAEVIGTHFSRFYPAEAIASGKPERELEEAAEQGRVEDEGWRIRKDGSRFWANAVITAVYDETGELRGFSKVTRDLTERRQTEERIRRLNEELEQKVVERTQELDLVNKELQQRNAELEQFLYTVSHDLKSPLVTIQGYSGYIKRDVEKGQTDRLADFVHEIGVAVDRMGGLINSLLDLSRIGRQTNPSMPLPMTELVQSIVQQHHVQIAEQNVLVEIQQGMPTLYADRERILEVFDNLLVNALRYGCGGAQPRITIGCEQTDEEARFFVKDNGVGISEKYHKKIFGLFQRLQADQGTGVGLAIVKRVVESYGGRIWVESRPGEGACFWVAFSIKQIIINKAGIDKVRID